LYDTVDMSRLSIKSTKWVAVLLVALAPGVFVSALQTDSDPVMNYYWERAGYVWNHYSSQALERDYRMIATTYYKSVANDGTVKNVDSATVQYYLTGGKIDSQRVISGNNEKFREIDLSVTDVFDIDNMVHGYPNDTGGYELAIGFVPDSGSGSPDGLLIIDRNLFYPMWLYLYYPEKPGYRRLSRSFRFTVADGLIVPDSIWEVGAKERVFSLEHYRIETGVNSVEILPNKDETTVD
jgi:hypothetical protein